MRNRTILLSLTFLALGGNAMAAIPDGAAPAKPSLNRASPMINDPVTPTIIRGKPSAAAEQDTQAALPNDAKQKPALYRASPMINDPLIGKPIHGNTPPASPQQ